MATTTATERASGNRPGAGGRGATRLLPLLLAFVSVLGAGEAAGEPEGPPAGLPPAAGAATAADADPVVIARDGVVLRRSEVEAALRSLPEHYRRQPLDQLLPVIVQQRLLDRAGPLDALRD